LPFQVAVSAEPTELTLHVNGETRHTVADPSTPVLFVLREIFGLTGTKTGCALGECGVCTIWVEGRAELACQLPVGDLGSRDVTTIEGLGGHGGLHPVQQAFIDEQAAQCGYCIPGMIMSAAALLNTNPAPTREEILVALEPNLCRCGTHSRILQAIERAAETISKGAKDD